MAARYGNVDVVSYLCSIRANPDLTDRVSECSGGIGIRTEGLFEGRGVLSLRSTFLSAGAGDAAALRCLARLLSGSPSSVPGGLPRGRQEPRGGEPAADGLCPRLRGHRGVPGGARSRAGNHRQGDQSSA